MFCYHVDFQLQKWYMKKILADDKDYKLNVPKWHFSSSLFFKNVDMHLQSFTKMTKKL